MHSLFNLQKVHIGAAGGGNLRYILVISPLVGVLAALAVDEVAKVQQKWQLMTVLAIFALTVAIFMTYKHNLIVFREEMGRDWMPLLGVVLTTVLLLLPLTLSQRITSLTAIMAFVALVSVKPIKLAEEDKTCRQLAGWYRDFEKTDGQRQVFVDHAMFNYYIERSNYEFTPEARNLTLTALQKAPKGSVIIWDTHYSYRPEWKKDCINLDYFQAHQAEYRLLQQFQSADQTFAVIVLEKL